MVLVVAWWTAIEEGLLRSRVVNPKVNPFANGFAAVPAVDASGVWT